jgi:hypothetical protein
MWHISILFNKLKVALQAYQGCVLSKSDVLQSLGGHDCLLENLGCNSVQPFQ